MPTGIETSAGLLVVLVTATVADAIRPNGRIRAAVEAALRKREVAQDAHAAIPDVKDTLETVATKQDQTLSKVEEIDHKTDRNAHLIREFHGEDEVNVSVDDILDDDPVFRGDDD